MSKLYYRFGAMGCGKTAALLQVVHNYERMGFKVILFKPSIDTKGDNKVVSRIGIEREVDKLINKNFCMYNLMNLTELNAIIVDEAQFLTKSQVDELYVISKKYNIPVLCYGLRCDFQMEGFEGSTRLLQIADDIEELKTICECGKKATQNLRLINGTPVFDGEQVAIDNDVNIEYKGVCGDCYIKYKTENKGEKQHGI